MQKGVTKTTCVDTFPYVYSNVLGGNLNTHGCTLYTTAKSPHVVTLFFFFFRATTSRGYYVFERRHCPSTIPHLAVEAGGMEEINVLLLTNTPPPPSRGAPRGVPRENEPPFALIVTRHIYSLTLPYILHFRVCSARQVLNT